MRTETRGESGQKVAQLEALREVGDAVGSSLDLDEVLDQIVSNAVRLTRTDGGSIMEYDESSDSFHVRAAAGSSPELLKELRAITIDREIDAGWSGRDRPPDTRGAGSGRHGARPASGCLVPRRLAVCARGSHSARRQDLGRPGDPASEHGLVRPPCRAARDVRRTVGPGHRQRAPVRGAADQDRRTRDRQPPQIGVPGQHVPRTADTAQRGDRLL